jgi:hypothetical protein
MLLKLGYLNHLISFICKLCTLPWKYKYLISNVLKYMEIKIENKSIKNKFWNYINLEKGVVQN